jgi:hypothetical protein
VQTKSASNKPMSANVENTVLRAKPRPVLKPAANTKPVAKRADAKKAATKAKPSRAAVKPAVKRAPRQAIAPIAIPEPLKPMSSKQSTFAKVAKRKR